MKTFLRSSYFILLFNVLLKTVAFGQDQNFPIYGTASVTLPASAMLEDYVNPITNPINLDIVFSDLKIPVRSVLLTLELNGPGISAQSAFVAASNSFDLRSGVVYKVPKTAIAACFSPDLLQGLPPSLYQQPLPSGLYTFSFTLRDVFSGAVLSKPIMTIPTWIEVSDPPLPMFPANYSGVSASQIQNVIFQWLPRHTPNNNVEYELTLTELPIANRGNLQNVFLSQPPLCKITTTQPTLLYDAKYPPLRQGAVYAWRVQVKPKLGAMTKVGNFVNEGYSEIFSFFYEKPMQPLNPPTDLSIAWSPDFNKQYYEWKGEENHVKYLVTLSSDYDTYNDQGEVIGKEMREYTTFDVEKVGENLQKYTRDKTNKINVNEAYFKWKIVVRAVDVFGRISEPVTAELAAIDGALFNEQHQKLITLNGKIESYVRAYEPIPQEIAKVKVTGEKSRFALKDAEVCFYMSNAPLTAKTVDGFKADSKNSYVACTKTDEEGAYSFVSNRLKIATLSAYRYSYLTIKGPSINFSDFIAEVEIPDQGGSAERTLATQTLLTNTFRLKPVFKELNGSVINDGVFEEINLYRLKSVYENNADFLVYEAKKDDLTEIQYNKNTYVKVANTKEPSLNLFSNEVTADNFVIGAKAYGKDEKLFPVGTIYGYKTTRVGSDDKYTSMIPEREVSFTYTPPLTKISGNVSARSKSGSGTVIPARNWEVGILVLVNSKDVREIDVTSKVSIPHEYEKYHWEEVTTDEKGNYELFLPEEVTFNAAIDDIIIYNRIPGIYSFYQGKRVNKPSFNNIVVDIDLQSTGAAIASVLKDQHGDPITSAKLIHSSGATASTNQNGEFVLNVQLNPAVEADPTVELLANGYITEKIKLSTFAKSTNTETTPDFGLLFWNAQVKELRTLTKNEFEELGSEDAFENNFKDYNTQLETFYKRDSVGATSIDYVVNMRTYVMDEKGSKQYVSVGLAIGEDYVDIPEKGVTKQLFTKGATLVGKIINKDKTAKTLYVDEELSINFTPPTNKRDTVRLEIKLTEAVLVEGIVTAYSEDSTKIGEEVDVTLVSKVNKTKTDSGGRFKIWLAKGEKEVELNLSKDGFNPIKWAFSTKIKTQEEKVKAFVEGKNDGTNYTTESELRNLKLAIYRRDQTIPSFKTLQGFVVNVEVIRRIDATTYLMTGSLDISKEVSIYQLNKGQQLTFKELEVKVDIFDKENAILVGDRANFLQSKLNLVLFNYANVELSNSANGNVNFIKLEKLKLDGRESFGKIAGVTLKFKPDKVLKKEAAPAFREFSLTPDVPAGQETLGFEKETTGYFEKELQKYQEKESSALLIPVFVSGGKRLTTFHNDLKFKLKYPSKINGIERNNAKDDKGNLTGKKEKISLSLEAGFSMLLDEVKEEASLTRDGVTFFGGELSFPMMKLIGIEDYMPLVEKLFLAPKKDLPLRELRLAKKVPAERKVKRYDGNNQVMYDDQSSKFYYVRLGVANSWRFEIDRIQVFDDFTNAGFGGNIYMDKENHMIVHSMAIRKANGNMYPFLDMEIPAGGIITKNIVFKSPEKQHILLGYNFRDDAYEIEAGLRMETSNTGSAPAIFYDIFPLEVEKLIYNTSGKFYVSVKVGKTVNVGPVKVNIRKVIFNKGGRIPWSEMLTSLQRSKEETAELNKMFGSSTTTNNTEKETVRIETKRDGYMGEVIPVAPKIQEIPLKDGDVEWALGIAGGVQVENLKGIDAQADASFVVGERNGSFDVQFNTIDLVMKSAAFRGYASMKISTSGDRVGLEGAGEIETMTNRWAASVKFYKLPNGIEFGASLKANAKIVTGPVMWTSVGGGVDVNTATNKYMVSFMGSAVATGTSPEASELRNIKVDVLFETDVCGALPVVKGSADWYLKQELYCSANVVLDFCRTLVLANINCTKELIKGSEANIKGTIFLTSSSVFFGANVKTVVLGLNANAVFMIGVNNNFRGSNVPREVAYYTTLINPKYLTDGSSTLNGLYLAATLETRKEFSGEYFSVFAFSAKIAISNKTYLFFSFTKPEFALGNDFLFQLNAYARVGVNPFSLEAYGDVGVRVFIEGGRNATEGWNFKGIAALSIAIGNSKEAECNTAKIKMCEADLGLFDLPYPCALSWKFCFDKSIQAIYREKGNDSGWRYEL